MKSALFLLFALFLVAAVQAVPGNGNNNQADVPPREDPNPNAYGLAKVSLTKNVDVDFIATENAIIVTLEVPDSDEEASQLFKRAQELAGGDVTRFYEELAGKSGNVPPGLKKKWDEILEARNSGVQNDIPAPPDYDDHDGENRLRRRLADDPPMNDLWGDTYCRFGILEPIRCECYKGIQGDRPYRWVNGQNLATFVRSYSGNGMRVSIYEWIYRPGNGWHWSRLEYRDVYPGNGATVVAAYTTVNYVGARITWAVEDTYDWSFFEFEFPFGYTKNCPNRNF